MTLDEYRREIGNPEFAKRERREAERRQYARRHTDRGGIDADDRRGADRRIHVYAVHDTPTGIATERIK